MAHEILSIWYILYHTTVDRKVVSVDAMLLSAHAFNKSYAQKFSMFGPNH